MVVNVSRGDERIRSWCHDNCVIPVRTDCYHRNSGGTFRGPNATGINAAAHQLRSQLLTKRIGPYIPDHANRIAKSGHSDGLIRALPAWMHLKIATVNGLSCKGNPLCTRDEVDVDAADHDDRFTVHNHRRYLGYARERKAPPSSP